MVFFDQPTYDPYLSNSHEEIYDFIKSTLIGSEADYATFLKLKCKRPNSDVYAAFQPFNESTRALYSLITEIKDHLKTGEPILDLWGRTAWSGEVLASYFPKNPVYMIWEGDQNVLGYKGYHYWLRDKKRLPNLHVIFSDLEKQLPFADNFFGLVHGLDTFHRYSHQPLLAECLRVAKPSSPLVFPHVHLKNSEPDPYFDRGCTQYHGKVYRDLFKKLYEVHNRKGYVLSEKKLFEQKNSETMQDDWNMSHYNALIYLAPVGCDRSKINPCVWPKVKVNLNTQVILNPLLQIDAVSGNVTIDRDAMQGQTTEMLSRHPIYEQFLQSKLPVILSKKSREVVFCVQQNLTLTECLERCKLSLNQISTILMALQENDICCFVNISESMAELQNFYGTQRLVDPLYKKPSFNELWSRTLSAEEDSTLFISAAQDIFYSRSDVAEIVNDISCRLLQEHIKKGDVIGFYSSQHPEYLLTIWAAWHIGAIVVPLNKDWTEDQAGKILKETNARILFVSDHMNVPNISWIKQVAFDAIDDDNLREDVSTYFSDWLDEVEETDVEAITVDSNEDVLILYTSGTTGAPKGVRHNFGNLLRGAHKLTDAYNFHEGDRYISVAEFHSMSGIRNGAVLNLVSGMELVLNDNPTGNTFSNLMNGFERYCLNAVFSSPVLLESFYQFIDRVDSSFLQPLKYWLCTGARISVPILKKLNEQYTTRFESYYGLTETGGFCTSTKISSTTPNASIGFPAGALFSISTIDGKPCKNNETGELSVYSDQLMNGYFGASDSNDSAEQNSWYQTGDLGYFTIDGEIVLNGREDEQFNTPTGDIINLSYIESLVSEEFQDKFVLLDNNGSLKVMLETTNRDDRWSDTVRNALLHSLTQAANTNLGNVEFATIENIPRNSNGKLERNKLKLS
ncbi:MAG: AMP-binding protein [Pseudomonadales bacterium]|nr:AMP-binding protein [Pseudomonadales bacterium]